MYAPQYPFAPGPNAPPPPQQQQPGYIQNPAAQQQQMMYNPQQGQQFGGMPMGGVPQQPPYGPGMNGPNMVPGPNAVMMQQNGGAGMPHMGPGNNGIASYQTPYNNSPYGMQGGPPSSGPQQQTFLPAGANAAQSGFVQPAPQQRMHTPQHQQQQMGTPQRGSSYGSVPGQHTTPPHTQAPSQFMPPQPGTPQLAMPMQQQPHAQGQQAQQPVQQPQSAGQTPVTPSFPTSAGAMATPLSPGSEVREKDRVSLLLDINRVLLMEVMRLQAVQAEAKAKVESDDKKDEKEDGAEGAKDKEKKDEKAKEKPKIDPVTGKEFVECMRRIQYNLAYLAAIADRSHKPSSQIPPHPAVISAPSLTPLPKPSASSPTSPNGAVKLGTDGAADIEGEDRAETLKKQYKRLQELFPATRPLSPAESPDGSPDASATRADEPGPEDGINAAEGDARGRGTVRESPTGTADASAAECAAATATEPDEAAATATAADAAAAAGGVAARAAWWTAAGTAEDGARDAAEWWDGYGRDGNGWFASGAGDAAVVAWAGTVE
ncbi:hypothetical protein V498_00468 [Pseudogymnoascus sp. VKM F-4517 (FW-2822)]|nr:hypothetical protein V498_00468 [Pseudogymnoascus sp. VKM F-4517 (FW-2822)]